MDSKQEYTGQTIAQLNDIRKGLLLELRDLRKRQADALDKVYLEVAKDQEDIAETYFTSGNETNGKFFSQRLDNCMRALRSEVKKLEESVGAQLGEIEEELDTSLIRLAGKEKELETLKNQIQGPNKTSKEYKEFLQNMLQKLPDASAASIDDSKLKNLRLWRQQYEARLEGIIANRTAQLEREIDVANHVHPDDEPPRMRHKKIENICQAVNKVIDVQLQNQHQVMDSERDRLLKQHFMDQMTLHKSYVNKYNAIKAMHQEEDLDKKKKGYHQNPLRLQQQLSIHSVHAASHVTTLPTLNNLTSSTMPSSGENVHNAGDDMHNQHENHDGKSWRLELVNALEESLEEGSLLLAEAHDEHKQWLSSLSQPVDIPPITMADLLAQQQLTLQSGTTTNRRSSVSFFTDADTHLDVLSASSAAFIASIDNPSLNHSTTPRTPNAVPSSSSGSPQHFLFPPSQTNTNDAHYMTPMTPNNIMTSTASPEKLVSKHYEDIVLKLAHVYQRFNDGRVVPLTPQLPGRDTSPEKEASPVKNGKKEKSSFGGLLDSLEGNGSSSSRNHSSPYRTYRKW